jgi:hypothetical protein
VAKQPDSTVHALQWLEHAADRGSQDAFVARRPGCLI